MNQRRRKRRKKTRKKTGEVGVEGKMESGERRQIVRREKNQTLKD